MKLRKRDVVLFRRGNNEYVGTIRTVSERMGGCIVEVEEGPAYMHGAWAVAFKSIVRVEKPVLTEKERAALALLAPALRPMIVAEMKAAGHAISAKTLRDLADRGFVVAWKTVGESGPFEWELTGEGRRVTGL